MINQIQKVSNSLQEEYINLFNRVNKNNFHELLNLSIMHSFCFPYLDPLNLVCFTYCNDPHQHVLYFMLWERF